MTGRVQLALNVNDLDESVAFYSKLFGTEPAKVRPGYANFAITEPPLKLILMENRARAAASTTSASRSPTPTRSTLSRPGSAGVGLASVDERDTTCCYARQDKFWVQGAPNGERWEIYTVLRTAPPSGARRRPELGGGRGRARRGPPPRQRPRSAAALHRQGRTAFQLACDGGLQCTNPCTNHMTKATSLFEGPRVPSLPIRGRLPLPEALRDEPSPVLLAPAVQHLKV